VVIHLQAHGIEEGDEHPTLSCGARLTLSFTFKDDGGGGDNWSYKTCKAPVKSSPPTNRYPAQDALPVVQPTSSKNLRKNFTCQGLAHPKLAWGLPTMLLSTKASWIPSDRVAKPFISPLTPASH